MYGLGELETAIMDRVWARGAPATVRQIHEDLRESRDSAYTTVMTVMGILHRKGYLRREREGRAWRYEAMASREQCAARLMRQALGEGRDTEAVLTHFLDEASPEQSEVLRGIVRRLEGEGER